MSWLKKLLPTRIKTNGAPRRTVPEGVWTKCPSCNAVLYRAELSRNLEVCPKCSHHMRITARERLEQFLDPESHREIGDDIRPVDKLRFRDIKKYRDRLTQAQLKLPNIKIYLVYLFFLPLQYKNSKACLPIYSNSFHLFNSFHLLPSFSIQTRHNPKQSAFVPIVPV